MKVCSKCGASVAAENKFCTMCGCLVEEVSNETTSQAAPIQDNMAMNQMPVNNMVQNNGMANGYNSYNQAPQYNPYMNQQMNNVNQGPKTNGLAIAGFICSLIGFLCCTISAVVGLVLSIVGLNKIKATGENGRGLAIAGIILGALGVITSIVTTIIIFGANASTYSSF